MKHGAANRRLQAMGKDTSTPLLDKWQNMLQVYLTTQLHVLSGMGYRPDENGLAEFAEDLMQCLLRAPMDQQMAFRSVRRDTWRLVVATTFGLSPKDMREMSIVEARNFMHAVSAKMVEPGVLLEVQHRTSKIVGARIITL
jgi:hypothetical protein